MGLRTKERQRIRHPAHWALVQTAITSKRGRDRRGGHRPHDQPHPSAGVATVDHLIWLGESANPHPMHRPGAATVVDDLSAEGLHRLASIQHIVAFQQPLDAGLPEAKRPQDQ